MKIVKKIALIIIGIIVSLIILEIGLQTAGFTLIAVKKYKNKITKDPNSITILCLGESTTDGQWPPILQKILDEKSKKIKFNVVDEGIIGTNSKQILKNLSNNLLKYNPNIVVSMIGINDVGLVYNQSKFKIINLIHLIVFHIVTHCLYTDTSFFEIDAECMELIKNNDFLSAQKKYYNMLKKSKFCDENIYGRLWELIDKPFEFSSNFYDQLLKYDKIFITGFTLQYIIKYLINYKNYNNNQIKDFLINNKDRIICNGSDYKQIIEILKNNNCYFLIDDIKQNNNQNKNFMMLNLVDFKNKENIKIKNYLNIVNKTKIFNDNILFIAMQYPLLPIRELKQNLKGSLYYDKLIFISNEDNFKQALHNHKTEEVFRDMFAGSFGHCTEFGNKLIAENVAETILRLYN